MFRIFSCFVGFVLSAGFGCLWFDVDVDGFWGGVDCLDYFVLAVCWVDCVWVLLDFVMFEFV